ncbi:allantoin permease [Paraburkholderia sp. J63]|uniref:purine-cytosine permease family protein n=1 Tax=Paraburkholderia sp. J63 TaxID=2805434 RepID=UPI002ABD3D8E|nr:allantoin permease [Paraburkholderia sp. J63]
MTEMQSGLAGEATDLSTVAVPANARMPRFALTMAWWSMCSMMFLLIVGATLALNYGTRNALIGMLLSIVAYSLVNRVIARYAIRTGFSMALTSQAVFGRTGAVVATLIFAATNIYYAVFESSVVAVAISHLWPAVPYALAALIVVGYSVPLVFGSVQNWLDKLNGVLLPFYVAGLIGAIAMATWRYGYHANWLDFGPATGAPANGWWHCFVYYMGCWAMMMAAFDFARFGREQDVAYHSLINFGAPFWTMTFLVNGTAGIYLVATIPSGGPLSEISVVFALLTLMGVWGFAFLWVTQTRINTASYLLATLNTHAFFSQAFRLNLPRLVWVILIGVVVYALMLSNLFAHLLLALAYQGVFIVAWVGVVLSHILLGDVQAEPASGVVALNRPAAAGGIAGSVVGLVLMNSEYASVSAPATFVTAVVVHRLALAWRQRRAAGTGAEI